MMAHIIVNEKYNLYGVHFEIVVIKTKLISDCSILAFSDFQDCDENNNLVFDFVFSRFNDLEYNLGDVYSICCGDMYGESYFHNSNKIVIKGVDGCPNYDLYNRTKKFYYIYGNHDMKHITQYTGQDNAIHIGDIDSPVQINEKINIIGIDGIKSSKNIVPSHNPNYDSCLEKKLMNNPYIFVSHDIPFVDDISFNPRKYGNKEYTKLINKHKPTINIFGHCRMKKPMTIINNVLFLNVDSRFILLLPS